MAAGTARISLLRISAPHFCAGVEIGGRVAPIVSYMHGWSLQRIEAYCVKKRWQVEVLAKYPSL